MWSQKLTTKQFQEVKKEISQLKFNISPAEMLKYTEMLCMVALWRFLSMNVRAAEVKLFPDAFAQGNKWIEQMRMFQPQLSDLDYLRLISDTFQKEGFKWVSDPIKGLLDNVRTPGMVAYEKQDDCDGSAILVEALFPKVQSYALWKFDGMKYKDGHVINIHKYDRNREAYAIMSNFKYIGDASSLQSAFKRGKKDANYACNLSLIDMRVKSIIPIK
jgi:hypothetical protein